MESDMAFEEMVNSRESADQEIERQLDFLYRLGLRPQWIELGGEPLNHYLKDPHTRISYHWPKSPTEYDGDVLTSAGRLPLVIKQGWWIHLEPRD